MNKLLTEGRTDLLDAFVSSGRRKFKAFLILKNDKSIGFEFVSRVKKIRNLNLEHLTHFPQ